jgi:hypothetical protein
MTTNLNKFFFNTGVKPSSGAPLCKGQEWSSNGIKVIPFECDAPKDAHLMFCCDNPNLPESTCETIIVREMFNTTMVSKYAYFRVSQKIEKSA